MTWVTSLSSWSSSAISSSPETSSSAFPAPGNSPNVLRALEYARSVGAATIGITGFDGGKLKVAAEYGVNVPVHDMQISEDIHMILDHLIYSTFSRLLPEE